MISLKDIRAVTFDVGGTLIEPWPSVGHVYAEVAARHGYGNISPEELTRRFKGEWAKQADFGYTRPEWAAIVDGTFGNMVAEPPSRTFFPALYEHFGQAKAWRVYEDVLPALKALSDRGMRLGIISNWDERLVPLLRELGLAGYFELVTVSFEASQTKPAKEIFELTARNFSLATGQIVSVGDGVREDVRGAQAAGFNALHLARGAGRVSDGQVNTLLEIMLQ